VAISEGNADASHSEILPPSQVWDCSRLCSNERMEYENSESSVSPSEIETVKKAYKDQGWEFVTMLDVVSQDRPKDQKVLQFRKPQQGASAVSMSFRRSDR
jgi:hypothetical protein